MAKIPPIKCGLFKFDITDYHAILGVPLGASADQIRKRYLKITRVLFPDLRKLDSQQEEELADQILAKLVNPAYEQLFKDQSARNEHLLILDNLGYRLAQQNQLPLKSKTAKEFAQADSNAEMLYRKYLNAIAKEQYQVINKTLERIALISELNLVFLSKKQSQLQPQAVRFAPSTPTATTAESSAPATTTEQSQAAPTEPAVSTVDTYLRRGKQFMEKNDYAKAVMEFREALNMEPQNSQAHSLLGSTYLKQGQKAMAKVHLNKALELDPNNEIAFKAKQFLDKQSQTSDSKTKRKQSQQGRGLIGGLFSKNKKSKK